MVPRAEGTLRFLTVEDFFTKGLVGSERISREDDARENNFFYFWRNVGRSNKSGDNRGRWGLGKTVFPASSALKAFFGVTVRYNDPARPLLMGQAVLRIHSLPKDTNTQLTPYGHYGRYEQRRGDEYFARPIDDDPTFHHFCRLFHLSRRKPDVKGKLPSGLSVVIPLPDADITQGALVRAALEQYFYPILSETLAIRVFEADLTGSTVNDQVDTLFTDAATRQRYERLFEFTRWAIALPSENYHKLPEPEKLDAAPNWDDKYLERCAPVLAQARAQFDAGERVAFTVPVKVQPKKGKAKLCEFKVFLERDTALKKAETHFVRQGITVTGAGAPPPAGLRGLAVIEDDALSAMLGDAENPAHTHWEEKTPKFKDKYEHGPSCLRFVKNSLDRLAKQLTFAPKHVDKDLLRDFFSLPDDDKDASTKVGQGKPQRVRTAQPDEAAAFPTGLDASAAQGVQLGSVKQGITFAVNDTVPVGAQYTLEFAYDARGATDPFKKYVPADFDFSISDDSQFSADLTGIALDVVAGNQLSLTITAPGATLQLRGFDPHRDLKVRAALAVAAAELEPAL